MEIARIREDRMVTRGRVAAVIVGYGYMGEIRRRVITASGAYRLVGIADLKPRPADVPTDVAWMDSYEELIARDDVDAVFVCVPNALIPEVACCSLALGKHVFCEKPPGRTVADIRRLQEAEATSAGRKLMFGFNHRFHPAMLEAKRIVDSGALGRVLWVKGSYGRSGGRNFRQSWRNDPAQSGGGVLLDQGIHMIDLFRYYCGDFDRVKAFCAAAYWDVPVEDNAFVIFANDRGQHGLLHSSVTLWRHTFRLEIGLADGYLVIKGLLSKTGSYGRETLTVGRRQFEDVCRALGNPEECRYYYDRDDSWALEVANFARAIVEDTPVEQCSSHDAIRALELVHAAYADSGHG
ncbi:MAG: Gfo/Idh/MocA family oxidoreductase [Phycisphaerae bacterium]